MNVALLDYKILSTNPIGGCHLRMLRGLSREHDFTVFAVEFENPDPERIKWVRIPAPVRPLALLFVVFHVLAPIYYAWYRWRWNISFDLVQSVETNLLFGDVAYSQFCHAAYLRERAPSIGRGIRAVLRWLDHFLHSALEPLRYRKVSRVVVPSNGLAAELQREFPAVANKITVISNPVDVEHLRRPRDFDRKGFRAHWGFREDHTILAFAALGHFERKGLPILLDAVLRTGRTDLGLIVIGGESATVEEYRRRTRELGIHQQVHFAGMQSDLAPFFWAADGFAFPSSYETFSLVTFEAAAAGLPLLVSRLYGVEELLVPGENGYELPRDSEAVAQILTRFLSLDSQQREAMGRISQRRTELYSVERFLESWRCFYRSIADQPSAPVPFPIHDEA
jgi:glycosyltransferase involved in cell wall biosynthesis